MLSKVNVAILWRFTGFLCQTKHIMCLNHEVFFISLLFRIVYSLNHILLPLFMLSIVNIALLRPFVSFHCLTTFLICLNSEVFFISLLFQIYSLNHNLLPLFMLSKVNIALLWRFIGFHCLTKLIICLDHEVFFMSLLFRIVYTQNHILLPLFMLSKVIIDLIRPFKGFHCLSVFIIC